jgi:hypothetical protein
LGRAFELYLDRRGGFSKDTKNHGRGEKTCVCQTGRKCHWTRKEATVIFSQWDGYQTLRQKKKLLFLVNKAAEFREIESEALSQDRKLKETRNHQRQCQLLEKGHVGG